MYRLYYFNNSNIMLECILTLEGPHFVPSFNSKGSGEVSDCFMSRDAQIIFLTGVYRTGTFTLTKGTLLGYRQINFPHLKSLSRAFEKEIRITCVYRIVY